jgi:outer membrane protein
MIARIIVLLAVFVSFNLRAEVTIGLINLQKVLNTINEGKSVNDKLKKSFDEKKATLTKEEDKIKKAQEEYMKQAALLSAEAKRKKEAELQQNIIALQKKDDGISKRNFRT